MVSVQQFPGQPPFPCPPENLPESGRIFKPSTSSNLSSAPNTSKTTSQEVKNTKFPGRPPGPAPESSVKEAPLSVAKQSHPSTETIPVAEVKPGVKRLHWQSLSREKLQGSIWEGLDLSGQPSDVSGKPASKTSLLEELTTAPLAIDYEKLDKLFIRSTPARSNGKSGSKPQVAKEQKKPSESILNPKRRQNVEICIKGLGLLKNVQPLVSTLELFEKPNAFNHLQPPELISGQHLTTESLEMISNLYPTESEQRALKSVRDPSKLDNAESFLLALMQIPNLQAKIECSLFQFLFCEDFPPLAFQMDLITTCVCKLICSIEQGVMRHLLYLVLQMGNYLNRNCPQGLAHGFAVDSLRLLKTTKSSDRTTTLLRILAETVNVQPAEAQLKDELNSVFERYGGRAGTCLLVDIENSMQRLENKLKQTTKTASEFPPGPLQTNFTAFTKIAEERLACLKSQLQSLKSKLSHLSHLLAHQSEKSEDPLSVVNELSRFWKDLASECQKLSEKATELTRTARRSDASETLTVATATDSQVLQRQSQRRASFVCDELLTKNSVRESANSAAGTAKLDMGPHTASSESISTRCSGKPTLKSILSKKASSGPLEEVFPTASDATTKEKLAPPSISKEPVPGTPFNSSTLMNATSPSQGSHVKENRQGHGPGRHMSASSLSPNVSIKSKSIEFPSQTHQSSLKNKIAGSGISLKPSSGRQTSYPEKSNGSSANSLLRAYDRETFVDLDWLYESFCPLGSATSREEPSSQYRKSMYESFPASQSTKFFNDVKPVAAGSSPQSGMTKLQLARLWAGSRPKSGRLGTLQSNAAQTHRLGNHETTSPTSPPSNPQLDVEVITTSRRGIASSVRTKPVNQSLNLVENDCQGAVHPGFVTHRHNWTKSRFASLKCVDPSDLVHRFTLNSQPN